MKEREAEVRRVLNEIIDPCSAAMGVQIGLGDMGIVQAAEVEGDRVHVEIMPTSPGCLYLGIFEHEIVKRLKELDWCVSVTVELDDGASIWDEMEMSDDARRELEARRQFMRREMVGTPSLGKEFKRES